MVIVKIQANFPPAYNLGVLRESLYLLSQCIVIKAGIVRVNTDTPVQTVMVFQKLQKGGNTLHSLRDTADGQNSGYTGILRSLEDVL
jgi:hypothetical protein